MRQCPLLLSDFNQTWAVSTTFSETSEYNISLKPVVLELLHADGRRDTPQNPEEAKNQTRCILSFVQSVHTTGLSYQTIYFSVPSFFFKIRSV
jgi:hypothetical protein